MSTVILPVGNEPWSEQSFKLDGAVYTLTIRWNTRDGAFFMDLYDANGDLLKPAIKLVCDWPLTGLRDTDPRMPPGVLRVLDTTGAQIDPTLDDLGTRCLLLYEEANGD